MIQVFFIISIIVYTLIILVYDKGLLGLKVNTIALAEEKNTFIEK